MPSWKQRIAAAQVEFRWLRDRSLFPRRELARLRAAARAETADV